MCQIQVHKQFKGHKQFQDFKVINNLMVNSLMANNDFTVNIYLLKSGIATV